MCNGAFVRPSTLYINLANFSHCMLKDIIFYSYCTHTHTHTLAHTHTQTHTHTTHTTRMRVLPFSASPRPKVAFATFLSFQPPESVLCSYCCCCIRNSCQSKPAATWTWFGCVSRIVYYVGCKGSTCTYIWLCMCISVCTVGPKYMG